jgi:adenylate cyclase
VAANPLQSAGLRFIQKFGVAFLWAVVFGSVLGAAALFRVQRKTEAEPPWHVAARWWLERLELTTYDWRAVQLGAMSSPSDDVVLVAVDDETLANAAQAETPAYAVRPWPRALWGAVAEQAFKEGAAVVVLDEPLVGVSPHQCTPCKGEPKLSDDGRLGALIAKYPGRLVLGADWAAERSKTGLSLLTPFMVRVAEVQTQTERLAAVQRVLEARLPAAILPSPTAVGAVSVWAGVQSEAKGMQLAEQLGVKAPVVRPRHADDDQGEVSRAWLAANLAEVNARGLRSANLTQLRSLDAPVAPLLLSSARVGTSTMPVDGDGRWRGLALLVATQEIAGHPATLASMPLQAALAARAAGELIAQGGRLRADGGFDVAIDDNAVLLTRFAAEGPGRAGQGGIKRSIPAWRLIVNMEDDASGGGLRHHDNALTNKVVVLHDPRSRPELLTPIGLLPHGAVMAQVIANLLSSSVIQRVDPRTDAWLTVAFAFAGALLAVAWSSAVRRPGWLAWAATLGGVASVYAFVARQLFVEQGRWVAMALPLLALSFTFLAALGYASSLELGLRDFMQRALGSAVRADVFRRVERDLALMRPERRDLTIYFSDIEGFTAVAQEKDPKAVVDVLRDALSRLTEAVLQGQGHVDKYLGDGFMAFWGAPVRLAEQVDIACAAALEMQKRFADHHARWQKVCGRPLILRAGIDVGPTVVGEMGTAHRVNYTVMGEPVATAFRLEALAKKYGVRILVTQAVVNRASARFSFRPVDRVRLGRQVLPVRLFELVGLEADLLGPTKAALEVFTRAMADFDARAFAAAKDGFEAYLAQTPGDAVAERFVARCVRYTRAAPAEGWDGVSVDEPR